MTFDGRIASIRATVIFSLYCSSSQNLIKILHEITVNNQGELDRFSRIFGFSVTPQLQIITSPDTEALATKISLRRR